MSAYFDESSCDIMAFASLCEQSADTSQTPFVSDIQNNIPLYDMPALAETLRGTQRHKLLAEWADVLRTGAGAIVLKRSYTDTSAIDAATEIYKEIIAKEKSSGDAAADHFAAGTNDRVWNSLQKLCIAAPDVFAAYFGNINLQAASEAWLGPNYQMTAQVNLVYPGGAAQVCHRDYHLGFQTNDISAAYPAHVHDMSPLLTLQGAVAHCDMPIESGPTKLLPYSQAYRPGYQAYRLPAFRDYFENHYVQLPLEKGDALFFNPALFHAAGENRTKETERMANLLQVSSAFGRALENVDRRAMCKALYPVLRESSMSPEDITAAIAACAEGYSFSTNLDTDPPIGGLAPETQNTKFHRALVEGMMPEAFATELDRLWEKQQP
jgi:ectoine hydroxylase-related dioxygenase (phytanoyl-CoA dioxygenase family)